MATLTTNASGFPMDQYNDAQDYGRAPYDVRNRAVITGNIGLPYKISASPFMQMNSGSPYNITTGNQYNGDGIFNARPSLAGTACPSTPVPNIRCTTYGVFNLDPAVGAAVIPFDYAEGPGTFSVNLRVSRTWGWGEKKGTDANRPRGGGGGPPGGGGRGALRVAAVAAAVVAALAAVADAAAVAAALAADLITTATTSRPRYPPEIS